MTATYHEVCAKSITRVPGAVDPWFLGRYGMNLYRGCEQGCRYCDGRAERYYVEGDFEREITVKTNAVECLDRELTRRREPGFLFVGGGVSDGYQPAEARYRLARGALELALRHRLPVHVLTKSSLVERDLPLLAEINEQRRAILSFSIQTTDDAVRARFEPGAAPIDRRFELLEAAGALGIATGVMAMPVLPGLSDQPEAIDALYGRAAAAGAGFVLRGGLTLRPGRQKAFYLEQIGGHHPDLLPGYRRLYQDERPSGAPDPRYLARLEGRFEASSLRHHLPGRIPREIFRGQMPRYAEAAVLLEHRELDLRRAGRPGGGLARSGEALQRWVRARFAKNRRRGYDHRDVEAELDELVAGGSLGEIVGLSPAAEAAYVELAECPGQASAQGHSRSLS